ncbi:MAG: galactokinase family protein, partial [Actinomycetota bacterium]
MTHDRSDREPRTATAPGRVNLMGDHTDYNDGLVLPAAIPLSCRVRFTPSGDERIGVRTDADPGREVTIRPGDAPDGGRGWAALVASLVALLAARGRPARGMAAHVSSDVPLGAGLSSSASFEVALALALCAAAGWSLEPAELAAACREAEEAATGVPCGPMDQLASLFGKRGHA